MSAGLGLLPGVLIDQHFEQRNRLGRLLALVAQSPALLGIGIDEDTAALVSPSGVMEVIGKGSVTLLDPARIQTDAYEVKRHRPMMISGCALASDRPCASATVLAARRQWRPVVSRAWVQACCSCSRVFGSSMPGIGQIHRREDPARGRIHRLAC